MLLITSATTAVNLDHCDANLRRCSHPGEEAGSVWLIERGVGVWESEAENDECVRKAERAACLCDCVCVDETTGLASVTQEPTNPSLICLELVHVLRQLTLSERSITCQSQSH